MKLLILFGAPAVGKTTVGQLLESQTDYKLFHNHMAMDGVMHIFGRNTPAENRLSRIIREAIITEAAESGINLIFTYVWNFSAGPSKKQNIDTYKDIYESRGGEVRFIELTASLEDRKARANSPDRRRLKAYAPLADDVAFTPEKDKTFVSPTPFYYPDIYDRIDTTGKTPAQITAEILHLDSK
jgi:hypothetical protein